MTAKHYEWSGVHHWRLLVKGRDALSEIDLAADAMAPAVRCVLEAVRDASGLYGNLSAAPLGIISPALDEMEAKLRDAIMDIMPEILAAGAAAMDREVLNAARSSREEAKAIIRELNA